MRSAYTRPGSSLFSNLLWFFSIFVFINAFDFQHNPWGGWHQQFMPFLNNRLLADIIFLDSLTGYAVTDDGNPGGADTNYILKSTNSGYNWSIINRSNYDFVRIMFLNQDSGYACATGELLRTTDAGMSWNFVPIPPGFGNYDMFAISYDTIWLTFPYLQGDYIYRTTNAGQTWTNQIIGNGLRKIYFFNNRVGFTGSSTTNVQFKTTNSGLNWIQNSGNGFIKMYFNDSLVGWKSKGFMNKTTDGGLTWINQPLPMGTNIVSSMQRFSNINEDTIWGGGDGYVRLGNSFRAILYRTTNSGTDWVYQIPDTSFHITTLPFVDFVNYKTGWAFSNTENTGIHTTTGGDTVFLCCVSSEEHSIPENFTLLQNYPNPFNPITKIIYELGISSFVRIRIYDLLGKEIGEFIDQKQNSGQYEVEFDGSALSSGIYFYSLIADNKVIDTKKMVLIR